MQDFYRCDEGYEEPAEIVAHNRCVKLVKDMHYEVQVQCVINYCAHFVNQKIGKPEVRELKLTREQYLQIPAWWCRNDTVCWERIVNKWFDPEWQEKHDASRQRRLLMPGPAHHQGSLNNDEYRARRSSSHEGQECTPFVGWALARKGKATSNVTYNPDDPPSAYSNPSVHSRIQAYTEMGRQVHGPDWDPRTQPLDGEVIMRVGGGKKHGRYYISDGLVDTASTPTLSQIRVRSTANSPAIRPRLSASQLQVQEIQVISYLFIVCSFCTYI